MKVGQPRRTCNRLIANSLSTNFYTIIKQDTCVTIVVSENGANGCDQDKMALKVPIEEELEFHDDSLFESRLLTYNKNNLSQPTRLLIRMLNKTAIDN